MNAETLKPILLCPVCLEVPRQAIFTCVRGHPVCAQCFAQLDPPRCPKGYCDFPETAIRNLAMEEVIANVDFDFACKHSGCRHAEKKRGIEGDYNQIQLGDKSSYIPTEILAHESICLHR